MHVPDFARQLCCFFILVIASLLLTSHSVPQRPHQVPTEGLTRCRLGLEQVDHVQLSGTDKRTQSTDKINKVFSMHCRAEYSTCASASHTTVGVLCFGKVHRSVLQQ